MASLITSTIPKKIPQATEIFISHSIKDKVIVDSFIDTVLHGALNVHRKNIFCISTEGSKIKSGVEWREAIKTNLLSAKIIFIIITPHFKESEMCLNEMGAAWLLSDVIQVIPLVVEPINFSTVGPIPEVSQCEKLLDEGSLDRLKDEVQGALDIPLEDIPSDKWSVNKKKFIHEVSMHIVDKPFPHAIDRKGYETLITQNADLNQSLNKTVADLFDAQMIITELKNAKNKDDVNAIFAAHADESEIDEFKGLVKDVKKQLHAFKPWVQLVLYKGYSGNDMKIDPGLNRFELDEAVARKIIDEDLDVIDSNKKVESLYSAIAEVKTFVSDKDRTTDFHDYFEENYDIDHADTSNLSYWEEVFEMVVPM